MRKLIVVGLLLLAVSTWSQSRFDRVGTPLSYSDWGGGYGDPVLKANGRIYFRWELSLAGSFREEEAFCQISGTTTSEYAPLLYTYDTYAYHNGNSEILIKCLIRFIENYYSKDYDAYYEIYYDRIVTEYITPPPALKKLFQIRDCDVAITYHSVFADNYKTSDERDHQCFLIFDYNKKTGKMKRIKIPVKQYGGA